MDGKPAQPWQVDPLGRLLVERTLLQAEGGLIDRLGHYLVAVWYMTATAHRRRRLARNLIDLAFYRRRIVELG